MLAFVGALQALLLWYMVNTYTARTEYRLEEDELVIVISRKFKGVKEIHLGYNDIFGVYRMKRKIRRPSRRRRRITPIPVWTSGRSGCSCTITTMTRRKPAASS